MKAEWVPVFVLLFVAGILVGFVAGFKSAEHTAHDCTDCFFALYDSLAKDGEVSVDESGAWAITWTSDSSVTFSGFSRTVHIPFLAPGDSVEIDVNLLRKGKP